MITAIEQARKALIGTTVYERRQIVVAVADTPNNDWKRVAVKGECYPRIQLRIEQIQVCLASSPAVARPGEMQWVYVVSDETGWDGYRETEPTIVAVFETYEEANEYRQSRIGATLDR